ncbi:MAG: magnesium/cobalt transporter CorA [Lentisphaerae bacterium]|nr:magnesium/cobalt transporter CorA [Lentisphaerota bacterium]
MTRKQRELVPGLPPGTLYPPEQERTGQPAKLRLLRYSRTELFEQDDISLSAALAALAANIPDAVLWLDLVGLEDLDCLHQLGQTLGLHPLALEDTLNPNQRAKLDFYPDHLYLCLKIPRWDGEKNHFQQVSFFLQNNILLTLSDSAQDYQQPVLLRLRQENGQIRKSGPDYLLYTLIDAVIDNYFPWLECLAGHADELEEAVLQDTDRRMMQEIHRLKREIVTTRQHLWPLREIVMSLARDDLGFIQPGTVPFLRDCYDHCLLQLEILDSCRDVVSSLMDIHLSNLSIRTNEVMQVLTVISTIFIPLTFPVGVYGMNFAVMPELKWRWGYAACWLTMLIIALIMLVGFRRKGWLGGQKNILKSGKAWRFPVILSLEDYVKRAGKAIMFLSEVKGGSRSSPADKNAAADTAEAVDKQKKTDNGQEN